LKFSNNHILGHLFFIGSSMKAISSSELGVWSLAFEAVGVMFLLSYISWSTFV
jgi:hypothetical protein